MPTITQQLRRLERPEQVLGSKRSLAIQDIVALIRGTEPSEADLIKHAYGYYQPNVYVNRFARKILKEQYNAIVTD